MGRPRAFDEGELLDAAAAVFVVGGYEGTSIDDLVTSLNVHRGSIYQAFGSKRGLFLAVVRRCVNTHLAAQSRVGGPTPADLDLLLVAALERGPNDPEVAELVRGALEHLDRNLAGTRAPSRMTSQSTARPDKALLLLGERLYERLTGSQHQPTDLAREN